MRVEALALRVVGGLGLLRKALDIGGDERFALVIQGNGAWIPANGYETDKLGFAAVLGLEVENGDGVLRAVGCVQAAAATIR